MASDAGAAEPPKHAATAAAAAAAVAPRLARANRVDRASRPASVYRASDAPMEPSNAFASLSAVSTRPRRAVPKLFLAGRDARAVTRARRGEARARIPAGTITDTEVARCIAARCWVRVGCVGSSFPGRAARSDAFRKLLSRYVAVASASWQACSAPRSASSRWCRNLGARGEPWILPKAARAGQLGPAARSAPPAREGGSYSGPRARSASLTTPSA